MPRWLMKLGDDEYVEWSTVVDAPVSEIVSRDKAVELHGAERVGWTDTHLCSCPARIGENIVMRNGRPIPVGGGRLAYHFDSYEDVHRFLLNDGHNQAGVDGQRATSIDEVRAAL